MGAVQALLRAVRAYLGAPWAYCGYGAGAATGVMGSVLGAYAQEGISERQVTIRLFFNRTMFCGRGIT